MTVIEALGFATFTIILVIAVLAGLAIVVVLQSKIIGLFVKEAVAPQAAEKQPLAQPAAQPEPPVVPVSPPEDAYFCGGLRLYDTDDETAAMVMAIVSDESGIPLDALVFKSIKKRSVV